MEYLVLILSILVIVLVLVYIKQRKDTRHWEKMAIKISDIRDKLCDRVDDKQNDDKQNTERLLELLGVKQIGRRHDEYYDDGERVIHDRTHYIAETESFSVSDQEIQQCRKHPDGQKQLYDLIRMRYLDAANSKLDFVEFNAAKEGLFKWEE